jgi:hypothetical protein
VERHFTITTEDGAPVSAVVMVYHGARYDAQVSGRRCAVEFPHSWVDQIIVNGTVVAQAKDIGTRTDLGTFTLARHRSSTPPSSAETLRGQLFFSDGTMCAEQRAVTAWFAGRAFHGRADENGRFVVALDGVPKKAPLQELYVDGSRIPSKRCAADHEKFLHVVLSREAGRGGSRGGLIAGRVLDKHGSPVVDAKVTAEIASSSMFFVFGGDEMFSTRTGKKGQFVLRFEGGTRAKRIYVAGDEPARIERQATRDTVPNRDIDAGTFDLLVTRKSKILGLF